MAQRKVARRQVVDLEPVAEVTERRADPLQRGGDRLGGAGTSPGDSGDPGVVAQNGHDQQPGSQEKPECRKQSERAPGEEISKGDAPCRCVFRNEERRDQESAQGEEDEHGDLPEGEVMDQIGMGNEDNEPGHSAETVKRWLAPQSAWGRTH